MKNLERWNKMLFIDQNPLNTFKLKIKEKRLKYVNLNCFELERKSLSY